MNLLKKTIKITSILLFIMIFMATSIILIDGYREYRKVIGKFNIESKVDEIRNSEGYVPIEEVSENFTNAIVAIEDHRFYKHGAIDLISIGRAMIENIKAGEVIQGGSTITQQLVKNLYLNKSQVFSRKVAEMFLAIKFEKSLQKVKF